MQNRIREKILGIRRRLSEFEWDEKSRRIEDKLLKEDFYRVAGSIFLYCHFDSEVKTDLLIRESLEQNKSVCIPFNLWKNNLLIPSRIYSEADIDRNKKIPQPFILKPFPAEKIDLAVIPGVVFDVYGNRIGMGRGFYDRFMKEGRKNMLKVSLAFDFQVMKEKLPVSPWDRCVDMIITENRIIDCR